MRRLLLPALVALLVPAAPAAAGWSADRTQTRAGTASGVR
ncbi:MAG: hypothetical protein JWO90_1097, partial [Solirubrobacterales bacterium]|nr:hypothetical protein [Solirubrobacterales bacterium]